MPISEWIEKFGRAIFETPFGQFEFSKYGPELAEIRLAVLDAVKANSHRVGGKDVFPYNLVRLHLRGVPEHQAPVFHGRFFTQFFEQELKGGLIRSNYRFPDDLTIEVETLPDLPKPGERWLWVEIESRARPAPAPPPAFGKARLVVLKGKANLKELALDKTRTNIGRTVDVYRTSGPSRRNDLAFSEETEVNRTVSREHAHIVFHRKTGEYRLFNDRAPGRDGACGLWIIRDGLSQEAPRDARGVRLEPGDEIHLGRAVVRFEAEEKATG